MRVSLIFFLLLAVTMACLTVRIAHITNHAFLRKELLARHKAKHGMQAYEVYAKVYSRRFFLAMMLISLFSALYVVSHVVELIQRHDSIMSLAISGVGVACGMTGFYLASSALKR